MNLKRYLIALFFGLLLTGCASSAFKTARSNANLVKNGMTVQQAVELIGTPPSSRTEAVLEWRRGTAQQYDATLNGAISFHVKDGLIVDVPEGGIFGPVARRQYAEERAAQRERQEALEREQQEKAQEAAAQVDAQRAAADAEKARANAEQARAEAEAEAKAAADARIACNVKSTCGKVFALAQIYIATETDQKIQVVTDSVIQTYNPTEIGNVGASIIKMPQHGDNAVVSLSLTCKSGDHETGGSLCRVKKTSLYERFRPFIESRLAQ
jgi:hypothetical protein